MEKKNTSEIIRKIALPLLLLGLYPLIRLISTVTINMPSSGSDVDVSLTFLEYVWAIAMAITVSIFYYKSKK